MSHRAYLYLCESMDKQHNQRCMLAREQLATLVTSAVRGARASLGPCTRLPGDATAIAFYLNL